MPFSVTTTGSPLRAARRIARCRPVGVELPAHLGQRARPRARARRGPGSAGSSALARVVLDADEVARRGRRGRSPPSRAAARAANASQSGSPGRAGSRSGSCRQMPAFGVAAPAPSARTAAAWAAMSVRVTCFHSTGLVIPGGKRPRGSPSRATICGSLIVHAHGIRSPSSRGHALAVALEALDRVARQPSRRARRTSAGCVKWCRVTNASRPCSAQRAEHAPVVLERRAAELARLGLDARPLERQPVRVLAQRGEQREVLRVAVVLVDRVARGLHGRRTGRVLPGPPVVVGVAALDLVGRGGGPEEEPLREVGVRRRRQPRPDRPPRAASRPCRSSPT